MLLFEASDTKMVNAIMDSDILRGSLDDDVTGKDIA